MWTKVRHRVFHFLFRPVVYLIFRFKYNFRTKKYKLPKEPHLILFNHPSNFDPIYVGASFNRPTYFIANDDLFNMPFTSRLISYLVAPIPTKKGVPDSATIRTALKVVKEGGNIGLAPEGNRTYSGGINHISLATIKFIKLLKIPVVLYNIKGGFGSNPRFSTTFRKGIVTGNVGKIIPKDDVLNLTSNELLNIINDSLNIDDSLLGLEYKGKNLAESMESAMYICPSCNSFNALFSNEDYLNCKSCHLSLKYNSKLLFESDHKEFDKKNLRYIYQLQENYVKHTNITSNTYEDLNISVSKMSKKVKREPIITGKLLINNQYITIINDNICHFYWLLDISSLTIIYHNTLVININNESYYLSSDKNFNALKYLHLFNKVIAQYKGDNNAILGI